MPLLRQEHIFVNRIGFYQLLLGAPGEFHLPGLGLGLGLGTGVVKFSGSPLLLL